MTQTADVASLDELNAIAAEVQADQPAPAPAPDAPPSQPEIPTGAFLQSILAPVFAMFAPNWRVSEAEVSQLAETWGAVIDKWFPDGVLNRFGPEIAAASVTIMVFAPRMKIPPKLPEPKPADTAAVDKAA